MRWPVKSLAALLRPLGRIRVRLLLINLAAVLVPVAGLEFARIYERQLLLSLQRDMRHQAIVAREWLRSGLLDGRGLDAPGARRALAVATAATGVRIRVLDRNAAVQCDAGPHQAIAPTNGSYMRRGATRPWAALADRKEVRAALAGHPDAYTRLRPHAPEVMLFVAEPVRHRGAVAGVVYVNRTTAPVLAQLYRVRTGLYRLMAAALFITLLLTLGLSWSISRPLFRLSKAARRIARGERGIEVPVGGSGEIRELGQALSAMTARLYARMRYIKDFAADVAHELKSPLTSIRGAAELLREGAMDDAEARRRFLSNIELDAERLDRLVSRLLELSRIENSDQPMREVALLGMLERVLARTHTAEQPVELRWAAAARSWPCREEDVERALLNLVENALRFSPPGEAVHLTVRQPDADTLAFDVQDRGPGIPPADQPRVFERFFTTDAERQGTGLGLAIVNGVAEAHRGAVRLRSAPGEGSCFTLELRR